MIKQLLAQAMSPQVLNQAWKLSYREHTPWSIELSRDALQKDHLKYILQCRQEVLDGIYKPQPIRQYKIPKPKGGHRIISAHYLKDKLVQRSLSIVLLPKVEQLFHNDSFAYRPKRSIAMALNKVRERVKIGQYWLVDADIRAFFDNIPIRPLCKQLTAIIHDKAAMQLLERWLKQGVYSSSLLGKARGILQGSVLSPLYCNIYLTAFDQAMEQAHIPFVRFADDFLLFTTSQDDALKAKQFAERTLDGLGLSLNPNKTRVIKSSGKVQFLGEKLPQYVK